MIDPDDPLGLRDDAPLLDGWLAYRSAGPVPFGTPGHKQRLDLVGTVVRDDIPLYGGVDTIREFEWREAVAGTRFRYASADSQVLGLVLTGMGTDGTRGGADIVAAGGNMIAQDEATSIVWGMPGAIAQAGLCSQVLPLPEIAPAILSAFGRRA